MAWPYDSGLTIPPNAQPPDLYREPTEVTAGDSLHWLRVTPDYPASAGWAITYYVIGPVTATFVSTASGEDHDITVAMSDTVSWLPGTYRLQGFISNGTERHRVYDGPLTVNRDPATILPGADIRTHARRTLDLIEAVLEGRAGDDVLNSSIEGTTISRIPPGDLLLLADRYRAMVRSEEAADAVKSGRASGRTIFARFTAPS